MLKEIIRKTLIFLHIDLTKNIKYDRLTLKVFDKILHQDSNCIDVGCFKGEILEEMLNRSPKGQHLAFEPVPVLFDAIKHKFQNNSHVQLFNIALNDTSGTTSFHYAVGAPAYSGIKKRDYDGKDPEIELIEVKTDKLDNVIPEDYAVDLIKIDVEGAEFNVLKGAKKTITKYKPIIIFEFGLGASDYYKTTPNDIYTFFNTECAYQIYLLEDFLKDQQALSFEEFEQIYSEKKEYYFISAPIV